MFMENQIFQPDFNDCINEHYTNSFQNNLAKSIKKLKLYINNEKFQNIMGYYDELSNSNINK